MTDRDQRYRGLVHIDDVPAAVERGDRDLGDILRKSAPTARAGQSLDELLGMAADNRLPIAVLGERERFLGILTRQMTLAALAGDRDQEPAADE